MTSRRSWWQTSAAALGSVLIVADVAVGQSAAEWNAVRPLQLQAEAGFNNVTVDAPGRDEPVSFSAITFGAQIRRSQSSKRELFAGFSAGLEASTSQVATQRIDAGLAHYVMGGVHRGDVLTPGGTAVFVNNSGLAVAGKLTFASVGISYPTNPDSNAEGQLVSIAAGSEAFRCFASWGCWTGALFFHPISFAASNERLTWQTLELNAGWRLLL